MLPHGTDVFDGWYDREFGDGALRLRIPIKSATRSDPKSAKVSDDQQPVT